MYEEKPIAIASFSEMNFIVLEKIPILQFDCASKIISPFVCTNIIFAYYIYILCILCIHFHFFTLSSPIKGLYLHAYFLWCIHYVKIFIFMSFFHLFALNSVFWEFLRYFLDLKFDIFPPWIHENNKILVWRLFKGENVNLQIKKNTPFSPIYFYRTYYFGKRHDLIKYTTFNSSF